MSDIALLVWVVYCLLVVVGGLAVAVFAIGMHSMRRFYFEPGPRISDSDTLRDACGKRDVRP